MRNLIRRVDEALGAFGRLEIESVKRKGDWSAAERKSTYRMEKIGFLAREPQARYENKTTSQRIQG